MAIETAHAVESSTGEKTDEAYITPVVDFLFLLIGTSAIALAGVAVIFP